MRGAQLVGQVQSLPGIESTSALASCNHSYLATKHDQAASSRRATAVRYAPAAIPVIKSWEVCLDARGNPSWDPPVFCASSRALIGPTVNRHGSLHSPHCSGGFALAPWSNCRSVWRWPWSSSTRCKSAFTDPTMSQSPSSLYYSAIWLSSFLASLGYSHLERSPLEPSSCPPPIGQPYDPLASIHRASSSFASKPTHGPMALCLDRRAPPLIIPSSRPSRIQCIVRYAVPCSGECSSLANPDQASNLAGSPHSQKRQNGPPSWTGLATCTAAI